MTARSTRFLFLRRASVAALGGVALLAACRAELPTSAELQAMDVASAEQRVGRVTTIDEASTEYFVDGKQVDRTEATKLTADRIASIDVRKVEGGTHRVYVVTDGVNNGRGTASSASGSAPILEERGVKTAFIRQDSLPVILQERVAARTESRIVARSNKSFDGLILIDGERATQEVLAKISPNAIQSVEVVKGQAAIDQYGQDGANGVIRVSTKK